MDGRLKHKDVEAEELEKKRLLDACRAVQTTTIERNSSKYRVDAKRMYREYTVECAEGGATLRHAFTARIKYMCIGVSFSLGCGAVAGLD